MNSEPNQQSLCNLMVEDADLKKLQELDPFQVEGYHSNARLSVPVKIVFSDQMGKQTVDTQELTFQILTRWMRGASKQKDDATLESMRVIITSEEDIFLAFLCNCSSSTFESIKSKNELNLHFNEFPATLIKLLNSSTLNDPSSRSRIELRLSHEGVGKLNICEDTDYKKLELLELFFQSCNIEKAHQSIIYRYNYNRTKLSMLQNSIDSVYKLLAEKNPPLLSYIQKTVGINE